MCSSDLAETGVRELAARRPGWDPARATRVLVPGLALIVALVGLGRLGPIQGEWAELRERRLAVGAALAAAGAAPDERLMSIDAAGYHEATGRPGVVIVADPLETNREVATAYVIRWLVLERDDLVPSMLPVLDGTARPAWIGPPILELRAGDPGGRMLGAGEIGRAHV